MLRRTVLKFPTKINWFITENNVEDERNEEWKNTEREKEIKKCFENAWRTRSDRDVTNKSKKKSYIIAK
jgi:hypothetical protein